MAAFSRGLRTFALVTHTNFTCSRCAYFSTVSYLSSGHNRWSKIKHDKASVDAKKNRQRSVFSQEIATASKLYGSNLGTNPRLAALIATAKKAGFPKASIETAVARGQGLSSTGAALESITLEAILPPSIALIVDSETDNRKRTLSELRFTIKSHGGTVAPTSYLFTKRGKVRFDNDERCLGVNDVLEEAIEAGAEDVETDSEGNILVWTEPSEITAITKKLGDCLDLKAKSSSLIWHPNKDTLAPLESEETAQKLAALLEALQDNPNVQGVYTNIAQGILDGEAWIALQDRVTD